MPTPTPSTSRPPATEKLLRVVLDPPRSPALNMALDSALLEGGHPATLRIYSWSPYGLSIGRFQDPETFRAVPGRHQIVQRVTGGGAIYHAEEITFALTVDAARLPASIPDSYNVLHDAIAEALSAVGVQTTRVCCSPGSSPRPTEPWCFADPGPSDLVDPSGKKILGSAQRRIRRPQERILHHGSLVLHSPPQGPRCAAVADQVDPASARPTLTEGMVTAMASALGLAPTPAQLDPSELAAAQGRLEPAAR